jgi:branched-chain amino acid transport system permease protein
MLSQLIINGIISGSVFSLIAIGFSLIYTTTHFFHFAHGAVYTSGAYLAYLFFIVLHLPIYIAFPLAIVGAAIIGAGMEMGVYRPMRKRNATSMVLLIASLGLFVILQNVISLIFGDDIKSIRTGTTKVGILIPCTDARITPIQITIIAVAVALIIITALILKFTRIGKALRAVASNSELARVSGIDIERVILFAFLLGSALAGASAILIALDIDMTPTMGFSALMMGVVAAIVGGVGNVAGASAGGFLMGLAMNIGVWRISSQWQNTIAFVILLIFLIFRPQGFFGRKLKRVKL